MTDKIVSFNGQDIKEDANPDIVSFLEQLLLKAKQGKITAIAAVTIEPDLDDNDIQFYRSNWQGPQITLLGALTRCQYALNRWLDND